MKLDIVCEQWGKILLYANMWSIIAVGNKNAATKFCELFKKNTWKKSPKQMKVVGRNQGGFGN